MKKLFLIAVISYMIFALCGCGMFQNNKPKSDDTSKVEKDSEQILETETEVESDTEMSSEILQDAELGTEISVPETQKQETPKQETPKQETPKQETPKQETPKQETPKQETPKQETPKQETPQPETPKQETTKDETPKVEETESESESQSPEVQRGQYLVKGKDITGASLSVGDGMYDITVTTVNGETVVLSELLKEKDMVMLNFWFSNCGPCRSEFPYMSQAYQLYNNDVEIIALNWVDSQAVIAQFKEDNQLPFKVAGCTSALTDAFGIMYYPTSVYIDRYGTICAIETGAVYSTQEFTSVFELFIGENYTQNLYPNGF